MAIEIERKFLVEPKLLPPLGDRATFRQFYLSERPAIRVRIVDSSEALLTIKGPGTVSRAEFEYSIPVEDAEEMYGLRLGEVQKIRYKVPFEGFTWEVDEFKGHLQGLWLAEITLPHQDASFAKPPWVTREVTEEFDYTNVRLMRQRPGV